MQLIKHAHACVSLVGDQGRIVIDPGGLTPDADAAVAAAEAVLITHEHFDHFEPERLRAALDADPALEVWTNGSVAEQLDGSLPLAPYWRARCLQLFVAGEPTCTHIDQLVATSSDNELSAAVRDTIRDGGSPAECWARLLNLLPPQRLATVFATAGPASAEFLLRQDLPVRRPAGFETLWPLLAGTLGWAGWSPAVVNRLGQDNQILRRQRTVLMIVAGALILVVVLLAILLRR